MAKGSKSTNLNKSVERNKPDEKSKSIKLNHRNQDYLTSMSHAPAIGETTHWFQMIPIAFFTAVVIMITKMASYQRPMDQFFWSDNNSQLTDFFQLL